MCGEARLSHAYHAEKRNVRTDFSVCARGDTMSWFRRNTRMPPQFEPGRLIMAAKGIEDTEMGSRDRSINRRLKPNVNLRTEPAKEQQP